MAAQGYVLTIVDFDGVSARYFLDVGSAIPQEVLDRIHSAPDAIPAPDADSFYSESYWQIVTADFVAGDDGTAYFAGVSFRYRQDITVMPACDLMFRGVRGDLYHYVTLTDATGGSFELTGEDGAVTTEKTVRIAVKDGSYVGYAKDYQGVRYVVPKEDSESGFSNVCFLSADGGFLDIYGTRITAPETYFVDRFVIRKDTYSILFEYSLYDEYGNVISYEKKHEMINIPKDAYETLRALYDEEYAYLRSAEFYAENETVAYRYRSYAGGAYDHCVTEEAALHGVIRTVYQVVVQRVPKTYTVTVVRNNENYAASDQEDTYTYSYNAIFLCPDKTYYKVVESGGRAHNHYFAGYDVDGDGVADYLPGERILITGDMRLNTLWVCAWGITTPATHKPTG